MIIKVRLQKLEKYLKNYRLYLNKNMKKILILSPGHQVYLVDLFKKYFEVYIGDRNNWVLATYKNIISIKMPSYSSAEYMKH